MRISAVTQYAPSRAREPCSLLNAKVPASLTYTFRLFSLDNIHFFFAFFFSERLNIPRTSADFATVRNSHAAH